LKLKQSFVDDAVNYLSIVPTETVQFTLSNNNVKLHSKIRGETVKFELPVGSTRYSKDFMVIAYADYFKRILNVMSVKDESIIYIKNPDSPLIFKQDDNNLWALTPIVEE